MKTKVAFDFNYRKATQALNHFALKQGGKINKMKALKLIYFADRYHLRKYGRLITNDSYVAMENGAVPSSTRDILQITGFIGDSVKDYASRYIATKGFNFKSNASPDENVFSDSDIEALEFAWERFGRFDQYELAELTHKYPEWIQCKEDLKSSDSVPMDITVFFNDPDTDVNKCFALSVEDKNLRREHLEEIAYIESLWR